MRDLDIRLCYAIAAANIAGLVVASIIHLWGIHWAPAGLLNLFFCAVTIGAATHWGRR